LARGWSSSGLNRGFNSNRCDELSITGYLRRKSEHTVFSFLRCLQRHSKAPDDESTITNRIVEIETPPKRSVIQECPVPLLVEGNSRIL
jgi:hypothetical protein